MRRLLIAACVLALAGWLATKADAAVTGEWRVNLLRGSSTIGTGKGATEQEAWDDCRAQIPANVATATTFRCQTPVYTAVVTPDATCPPAPAPTTRTQQCPTGTVGTWQQTSASTVGAPPACTVTTTWSPSSPPAGACVVPNSPPTISGTPIAAVEAGQAYSFTPAAADADLDTLAFTIENRPTWAAFDVATGKLSGTPALSNVGVHSSIRITVSDGRASASTSAFSITVTAPPAPPPTSETWTKCATEPSLCSFTGTRRLRYGVEPNWVYANLTAVNGGVACTNATFGRDPISGVRKACWLSSATSSPPPTQPPPATGTATIRWTPPTQNSDGSALTNLAGFRIAYGNAPSALSSTVQITNPGLSSYVIEQLATGAWYFAVSAYTSTGASSANSNVATKTIP